MDILFTEIADSLGLKCTDSCYRHVKGSFMDFGDIVMEKGFFFLLVTNGTASVSDIYHRYTLSANDLLVLTPSVRGVLSERSTDFFCSCLYIVPDYFDTLSAGQLLYNQVSQYIGNYQLPIFSLDAERVKYLSQVMSLLSPQLEIMHLYQDGSLRHLFCFLLLQIADTLYKKNRDTSGYVRRSSEIFRNFKKLLVHHYRDYHTISFYADKLNVSTTYLSRVVKRITGHTVCFHISELLCADARKMLECTDMDVQEIADVLGFSDQSVFGKFFLRKTGMSPMNFRKRKE